MSYRYDFMSEINNIIDLVSKPSKDLKDRINFLKDVLVWKPLLLKEVSIK